MWVYDIVADTPPTSRKLTTRATRAHPRCALGKPSPYVLIVVPLRCRDCVMSGAQWGAVLGHEDDRIGCGGGGFVAEVDFEVQVWGAASTRGTDQPELLADGDGLVDGHVGVAQH